MAVEWLEFDIKTVPKEVSLFLCGKIRIDSDERNAPDHYIDCAVGIVSEEDVAGNFVLNMSFGDHMHPSHYAVVNWPDSFDL
jgi:hypothetical protein